ncbi:MAG TPA: hypothetical protein VH370_08270 [Humisphaera sp.]|jgi:hypothetical protein|nr:hypothetical protein [Humisphaera sp.]
MIALNAHFDGKVIVPDEPLDLPANQKIRISIEPIEQATAPPAVQPKLQLGLQRGVVTYAAPDWEAPLPDDIWDHNRDDEAKP